MSPYWFIAFIVWTVVMVGAGYEGRGWQDKAAQGAADTKAALHKGDVESKGATINQGAENDFNTQKAADDILYNSPIVSMPPDVNHLPILSSATTGVKPPSCGCISLKYKLTPKQCDIAKDGYIDLWDAWVAQAAVK